MGVVSVELLPDAATADSTVTYGAGPERIVLRMAEGGGCECTSPLLPKRPARRDTLGVAFDALTTMLMKMAGAGLAMDTPQMREAVQETVEQLANDWDD